MNKPIIIGAGISGLSAANYLADNEITSIIIEPSQIGRIKVCGEFFSCESIPYLKRWNIPFLTIRKANFNISGKKYSFNLPSKAASTSRSKCELELAKRATNKNVQIISDTVEKINFANQDNDLHLIKLSSGKILQTNKIIITTSKLPLFRSKTTSPTYLGIKSHFTNVDIPNELNMYLIDGAYMGLTYIDNSTVNICCLAKKTVVDKYDSVDSFMNNFFSTNPELNKIYKVAKRLNENWLIQPISQFGKKSILDLPNTYFIGDAISTIHPASGNGLAMGLTSGVMAAEHIITQSQINFNADWNLRYNSRLNYANLLHSFFISENKSKISFKLASLFPGIVNLFYKFTRDYY